MDKTAMSEYQGRLAREAAAAKNCVCVAPHGIGLAHVAYKTALLLGAKNILSLVPKSIALPAWKAPLAEELGLDVWDYTDDGKRPEACHRAHNYAGQGPLFSLAIHGQAACIGAWCESRQASPFDLIIVDGAAEFQNPKSMRAKGLGHIALGGKIPCIGFLSPAFRDRARSMPRQPWGGPSVIDFGPGAA